MKTEVVVEEGMDVFKLLSYIQKELRVPKDKFNAFGKYHYRSTEGIVEAVKKLLPEGAYLIVEDEIQVHGENEYQRFYVKATAELWLKGYSRAATGIAREPLDKKGMDSSQITGAASSYARKYALNGLFCIDDSKDADDVDNREPVKNGNGGEVKYKLLSLINELNVPEDVVNKWLVKEQANDLSDFSKEQATKYIQFLESKRGQ